MIKLGQEAKDKITGFKGILIGKIEYLTGCDQYGITPKSKGGQKSTGTEWFDEGRIEVIGTGVLPEEVKTKKNGGPNRDAPR